MHDLVLEGAGKGEQRQARDDGRHAPGGGAIAAPIADPLALDGLAFGRMRPDAQGPQGLGQLGRIPQDHADMGKALHQMAVEQGVALDHHQASRRQPAAKQGVGDDPGAPAQLDDPARAVDGHLTGNGVGEPAARWRDGAHLHGIMQPAAQEETRLAGYHRSVLFPL